MANMASTALFSEICFPPLALGSSLYTSFINARAAISPLFPEQTPWLDDDGSIAQQRGYVYADDTTTSRWPPHIATVTITAAEDGRSIVEASILAAEDNPVQAAWVVFHADDGLVQRQTGVAAVAVAPVALTLSNDGVWRSSAFDLPQNDAFRAAVYAESADGQSAPRQCFPSISATSSCPLWRALRPWPPTRAPEAAGRPSRGQPSTPRQRTILASTTSCSPPPTTPLPRITQIIALSRRNATSTSPTTSG
ncbi:MAG: hypothetical protein R2873_28790 [Caldilineaceae bacterium]